MRILYAEDNEEIREILALRLKSLTKGEVLTCENGQEAIGVLEGGVNVDLVISDHFMDGGNGLDLYNFMRRSDINVPFILMTGAENPSELGFGDFLEHNPHNALIAKPPKMAALKDAVMTVVSAREGEPEGLPQSENGYVPIRLKILYRSD